MLSDEGKNSQFCSYRHAICREIERHLKFDINISNMLICLRSGKRLSERSGGGENVQRTEASLAREYVQNGRQQQRGATEYTQRRPTSRCLATEKCPRGERPQICGSIL